MSNEIPSELLLPTVEELEKRTAQDLETKWKPCKRLGKKERMAMKKEKETAKLKAIAEEFGKPKQTIAGSLSSLFVESEKLKFSLCDVNAKSSVKAMHPTLRVSLDSASSKTTESSISQNRKRGRAPKVKSI
jgi:hypothetical protein